MNDHARAALARGATQDITSLRSALSWLRAQGYLIETEKEVNPDLEITGLQKHFDGSFPIRALTLDVGTRRPLGAGAGGLALLMPLPDAEVNAIVNANAVRLRGYNNLTVPSLTGMLKRARELGYALNDNHITPGATSIGLAIISRYGQPFAAISVGAISSRMNAERQKKVAAMLRREVKVLEQALSEATRT